MGEYRDNLLELIASMIAALLGTAVLLGLLYLIVVLLCFDGLFVAIVFPIIGAIIWAVMVRELYDAFSAR